MPGTTVRYQDVRRLITTIETEVPNIKKACADLEICLDDLVSKAIRDSGNKKYKTKVTLFQQNLQKNEQGIKAGKEKLEGFANKILQAMQQ